jgi:hypothetical protein
MKNLLRILLIATTLTVVTAASSEAAIIDFTDEVAWGGADGATSYTSATFYDGVMVQIQSFTGAPIRFNDFGGGFGGALATALCQGATGGELACNGDGLGIGDDEISFGGTPPFTFGEAILVTFFQPFSSTPQPVDITRLGFLDLFASGSSDPSPEVARWVANTAGGIVEGSLTGTQGPVSFGVGVASPTNLLGTVGILFFTGDLSGLDVPDNSDFALAGIEMTPTPAVPEPATLFLTGAGLFAAAYRARRRRA